MSIGKEIYNFFFKKERRIEKQEIFAFCDKVEKILIQADLNEKCTDEIMYHFKRKAKEIVLEKKTNVNQLLFNYLYAIIRVILKSGLASKFNVDIKNCKKITFFGLSGCGKTSTVAKVAKTLTGRKSCCIRFSFSDDNFQDIQLQNICRKNNINYIVMPKSVEDKLEKIKELEASFDCILIDTDPVNNEKEILLLKKYINIVKTDLSLFVIDAMSGASVFRTVEHFVRNLKINSFIVSKTDSNSRFGIIFYIVYLIKLPILFITDGEKINNIEKYNPDKIAMKLVGLEESIDQNVSQKKLSIEFNQNSDPKHRKFNLNNLLSKMQELEKNFTVLRVNNFFSIAKKGNQKIDNNYKKTLKVQISIISSMTKEERLNPHLINHSRTKRIARGSGVFPEEVMQLLSEFNLLKNEIT